MKSLKTNLCALLFVLSGHVSLLALVPESLSCDYRTNPLGVENPTPALGWVLRSSVEGDRQTAYEVEVASSRALLLSGRADMWASGRVESAESRLVRYAGKPLASGKACFWRARVWDARGKAGAWSAVNRWSAALKPEDWQGQWIGAITHERSRLPQGHDFNRIPRKEALKEWAKADPLALRSICLRKSFRLDRKAAEALIYVSGLGQYELYVNGVRADGSPFNPLWSDYDKTVYYNVYDIAGLLRPGGNVIGVVLGNGMYNVSGNRYSKFLGSYGPPTLMLQAEIGLADGADCRIVSDDTWKWAESPVTFNCIFGGEDYDARLEQPGWSAAGFDDSRWSQVVLQEAPAGTLRAQSAPSIAIAERYGVREHREVAPGHHLFDMGQNLSGYPTIRISGRRGQTVRIVVGEILDKEGKLVEQRNSGKPYYFEYTLKGDGIEQWTPRFTYYGYQYIEIDGVRYLKGEKGDTLPVLHGLTSNFIHSSAVRDGRFHCSNELFNRTLFIIDKASRSNMQSVLTDCPHREKLGWLEETHLNGPGLLYNYDLRTYYPKLMRDIADSQRPDGLIPDIAPEYVRFRDGFVDSPEWGVAGIVIPWLYYEWYGDDALIREYYPVMKRYVDYLSGKAKGHILSHGLGDWYDHGPRGAGVSQNTPIEITATGHYYLAASLTARAADRLGIARDADGYGRLASEIAAAFNAALFDPATRQYGSGSQCSNALPLFLGIVPSEYRADVLANLLRDIVAKDGKLSTGDVGNRYLYQALARNGCNDVMYRMHNHSDVPGYGYQIGLGVTTLTEQWDPTKGTSWNHFMMGHIVEWFYRSLAGIRSDPEKPGFRHFFIEPCPVGDLTFVESSYRSEYGTIVCNWKIGDGRFRIDVVVPVNTTATLVMPFGDGRPVELCSGRHTFTEPVDRESVFR